MRLCVCVHVFMCVHLRVLTRPSVTPHSNSTPLHLSPLITPYRTPHPSPLSSLSVTPHILSLSHLSFTPLPLTLTHLYVTPELFLNHPLITPITLILL